MDIGKPAKFHSSKILDDFFFEQHSEDLEYMISRCKMILATRISKAIVASGLSKKEFSLKMNVQPSVISKWLSGTHNFTIHTLVEIEQRLNSKIIFPE